MKKGEPIPTTRRYCRTCGKETECMKMGRELVCSECLMRPETKLEEQYINAK
jgi:hypothetical protein